MTVLNALGGELESQSSFVVAAEVRMRLSGLPVTDRRFDSDPARPVQKAELTTWAGDSKWDLAIRVGASRSPTRPPSQLGYGHVRRCPLALATTSSWLR